MTVKNKIEETISTKNFTHIIRLSSSLLIFVVLVGFVGGIVKTFIDLGFLIHGTIETGLKQLLINALNLLAVIEVLKTGLSYLSDGRVRVTYIVDTVLIVMLNEVIKLRRITSHKSGSPTYLKTITSGRSVYV